MRPAYPKMRFLGTCECDEEDPVCDQTPVPHAAGVAQTLDGDVAFEALPLTIHPVPYDFGLSASKSKLSHLVETPFTLVLDDDFTRTHHTCVECMLQKMYSHWHTSFLPTDLVGFPVLEDERNFGAYRGKFRQSNGQTQLFLEPFYTQSSPDGCVRVDFCPMVYLARTQRLQSFEWKPELKVGEHEYFFYTNKLRGIQTSVCFDSSLAHSRAKKAKVPGSKYLARRDRVLDLMMGAFKVGSIFRVMYLFRTYQMTETKDFDEMANREVAPWDISDDTCGAGQPPVAPFVTLFSAIFSLPQNGDIRSYLRWNKRSWLYRLRDSGDLSHVFIVPGDALVLGSERDG